jgi:hypothetical protein
LFAIPKAVERKMGHVFFEKMICESENATADTVGIVIEYCDSSIFQVMYDPVRKNKSIKLVVHNYITQDGYTTIEETKESDSGGKYVITTTKDREQLVKDLLNKLFLDLQKSNNEVA